MNGALFSRIYLSYGRAFLTSHSRFISTSCCRHQQAAKVKSAVDDKAKKSATEKEKPDSVPSASPASDVPSEKPVFREYSTAFSPPTAELETPFSPKISQLIDEIASLTLVEVGDLNKALKIKLNLPDVPVYAASAAAPGAAAKSDEDDAAPTVATAKTKFSIKLTKIDDSKKIAVIKEIKAIMPNLNLVQAKKVVETLPQVLKGDLLKDEAEKLVAQFSALGAVCEMD